MVLAILTLNASGLYRFNAIVDPARQVFRIIVTLVGVFLLLTSTAFALRVSEEFSRGWAFLWLVSSIFLVVGFRILAAQVIRSRATAGKLGRRILVYGANEQSRRLLERIDGMAEPWNHVVGVFDDRLARVAPSVGAYPVLGNLDDLIAWARNHGIDDVLIALPWSAESRLLDVTRSLAVLPANVRLCPEFFHEEMIHGRTSYQYGLPMLSAFEKPVAGWDAVGKRAFDLLFSCVVLLFAAPLLVIIATIVKLESPGPVFFRQKRFGFNNDVIEVYKFRTMRAETSDVLGDRLTERNDPRVTRVGSFLRRTSLDELPQIINVLRGEMSVVGPRPHAIRTTAGGRLCEDVVDRYSVRHKVRPGITGWAQVNGYRGTMQDEEQLRKRVEHDLHYINNRSPWFDLQIVAMTAWAVLHGRNSY